MTANRYDEGLAVRREVLGDSYVEQAAAKTTDFTRDFQRIVTEFAWGMQAAVYCGVPDANAAFRVAASVFDEADKHHDSL